MNIPEPVQYKIYTLALPFDLRCESGTHIPIYPLITYVTVLLDDWKTDRFLD